jgi:hypothetical protein
VLDGLDEALLGDDTHDLILWLAAVAREPQPTWRLVLIGYRELEKMENRLVARIDHEVIDLDQMRVERDVRIAEALTVLYVERERQQGRDADEAALQPAVEAAIARVLAKAPENGEGWLRMVGMALVDEARLAFAESDGAAPGGGK